MISDHAGSGPSTVIICPWDVTAMLWSTEAQAMDEKQIIDGMVASMSGPMHPIIITNLRGTIVAVNNKWENMCKFSAEEAFGQTPSILQGRLTNLETAKDFAINLRRGNSIFASVLNYKKDGTLFLNHIFGWFMGDLLIAETYLELPVVCPPDYPPASPKKITEYHEYVR
ncbi:MAG: hypothetical protein CMP83_08450 [Gammaproteobacteria bacterium]|nr:hypothetical protein [Gammaproteobacteria bacterium]